jgi:hypothetical protein
MRWRDRTDENRDRTDTIPHRTEVLVHLKAALRPTEAGHYV